VIERHAASVVLPAFGDTLVGRPDRDYVTFDLGRFVRVDQRVTPGYRAAVWSACLAGAVGVESQRMSIAEGVRCSTCSIAKRMASVGLMAAPLAIRVSALRSTVTSSRVSVRCRAPNDPKGE
jgi:hypothetical protein